MENPQHMDVEPQLEETHEEQKAQEDMDDIGGPGTQKKVGIPLDQLQVTGTSGPVEDIAPQRMVGRERQRTSLDVGQPSNLVSMSQDTEVFRRGSKESAADTHLEQKTRSRKKLEKSGKLGLPANLELEREPAEETRNSAFGMDLRPRLGAPISRDSAPIATKAFGIAKYQPLGWGVETKRKTWTTSTAVAPRVMTSEKKHFTHPESVDRPTSAFVQKSATVTRKPPVRAMAVKSALFPAKPILRRIKKENVDVNMLQYQSEEEEELEKKTPRKVPIAREKNASKITPNILKSSVPIQSSISTGKGAEISQTNEEENEEEVQEEKRQEVMTRRSHNRKDSSSEDSEDSGREDPDFYDEEEETEDVMPVLHQKNTRNRGRRTPEVLDSKTNRTLEMLAPYFRGTRKERLPDSFSGKLDEDVNAFVEQLRDYITFNKWTDEETCDQLLVILKGAALEWYKEQRAIAVQDGIWDKLDLEEILGALIEKFTPSNDLYYRMNSMSTAKQKKGESSEEYYYRIKKLAKSVDPNMKPDIIKYHFIQGLLPKTKAKFEMSTKDLPDLVKKISAWEKANYNKIKDNPVEMMIIEKAVSGDLSSVETVAQSEKESLAAVRMELSQLKEHLQQVAEENKRLSQSQQRQFNYQNDLNTTHRPKSNYKQVQFRTDDVRKFGNVDITCFTCGVKGHLSRDCPNRRITRNTLENQVNLVRSSPPLYQNEWRNWNNPVRARNMDIEEELHPDGGGTPSRRNSLSTRNYGRNTPPPQVADRQVNTRSSNGVRRVNAGLELGNTVGNNIGTSSGILRNGGLRNSQVSNVENTSSQVRTCGNASARVGTHETLDAQVNLMEIEENWENDTPLDLNSEN
jgi:hypothetical protein